MKSLLPLPHPDLHPLARLLAWHRALVASVIGLLAASLLPFSLWEARLLAGWLTGAFVYLVIVWWGVGRLDAAHTRLRASSFDPGTAAMYALVVATSWISLGGVLLVTHAARTLEGVSRWSHIGLAMATLAATWLLIQTVFALHYARRFYREDAGGLVFPGTTQPAYQDFAYFSAVIGMTSQVADVGIALAAMRRLVLVHGLISFGFNLMVLALILNLVASALG
jgi:uncharacterized membrane protein